MCTESSGQGAVSKSSGRGVWLKSSGPGLGSKSSLSSGLEKLRAGTQPGSGFEKLRAGSLFEKLRAGSGFEKLRIQQAQGLKWVPKAQGWEFFSKNSGRGVGSKSSGQEVCSKSSGQGVGSLVSRLPLCAHFFCYFQLWALLSCFHGCCCSVCALVLLHCCSLSSVAEGGAKCIEYPCSCQQLCSRCSHTPWASPTPCRSHTCKLEPVSTPPFSCRSAALWAWLLLYTSATVQAQLLAQAPLFTHALPRLG